MSSNTLMETLKIEFTEIGDNYVVCRMPVTPEVHQPAGILHGGATAALVETAGSFASRYFIKDPEISIRGIEISTNHVKSISEGFVYASDNNTEWMTDEQLSAWIDRHNNEIGKI